VTAAFDIPAYHYTRTHHSTATPSGERSEQENPMNPTISIGDVFVGDRDRTFKELRVIAKVLGYASKWRCIGTRHDGSTTPTNVYASTLLYRYERKSTRDFNVNTEAYQRRDGIDIPAVPTALIRNAKTVELFIGDQTSTLLHVDDGVVRQAKSKDAKIQLLLNATGGLMMLAVPGKHSQDVFFVDQRDDALNSLGLTKSAPVKVVTDALGNTWVAA
jgi:hypothetical protein